MTASINHTTIHAGTDAARKHSDDAKGDLDTIKADMAANAQWSELELAGFLAAGLSNARFKLKAALKAIEYMETHVDGVIDDLRKESPK